jgi:serine/threonine protein kinase
MQMTFSPDDFVFKEKLGEGFFANVKKIISKHTQQEMVLKELKLNCVTASTEPATSNTTETTTDHQQQSDPPPSSSKLNLLVNYAELNAAHKSFLKEAQVLRNLNHPNIIKFIGIMFTKEKHLNLILEYISGGMYLYLVF